MAVDEVFLWIRSGQLLTLAAQTIDVGLVGKNKRKEKGI
jgi:hypothetical protein